MNKLFFALSALFMHFSCQAQFEKERSVWYFGNNAGIDFRTSPPTVLTDGKLSTSEGCAVASDDQGNLLFYSDGITIWNKNHQVMTNGTGLLGDGSSTQAALIARKPGSSTLYYVFTTDEGGTSSNGFNYTIVDMNRAGGLGEVILKNQKIMMQSSEKLGACLHQNGQDIWIVTETNDSQITYRSYLFTSAGINPGWFVTNIGTRATVYTGREAGTLKFSFDNRKVAIAHTNCMSTEVFDFDNATGKMSNGFALDPSTEFNPWEYGIEFSSTSRYLYTRGYRRIIQYDLFAGDSIEIRRSGQLVYEFPQALMGDIALATNGKIYITLAGGKTMAAIPFPDKVYPDCGFEADAIDLGTGISRAGLPNFVTPKNNRPFITWDHICENDSTLFRFSPETADSVKWDFGDIFSAGNTSAAFRPYHQYPLAGHYKVTLIRYLNQVADTLTDIVHIYIPIRFNISQDTTLCIGDTVRVTSNLPKVSYTWSSGNIGPAFPPKASGTYTVTAQKGCLITDSIYVDVDTVVIDYDLGYDTVACTGHEVMLRPGVKGGRYLWQDGSTDSVFQVKGSGKYFVTISSKYCPPKTDTVTVWDCYCPFKAYNVFTPNNDQVNDSFKPEVCPDATAYRLIIYNRWGQSIFETDNINTAWDGQHNSTGAPEGTYFWTVRYNSYGVDKKHNGTLTLMR